MVVLPVPEGRTAVIEAQNGDIGVTVNRIYGRRRNRVGQLTINGSPRIANGASVQLTNQRFLPLDEELSVKVLYDSPGTRLKLYFYNPLKYDIYVDKV